MKTASSPEGITKKIKSVEHGEMVFTSVLVEQFIERITIRNAERVEVLFRPRLSRTQFKRMNK